MAVIGSVQSGVLDNKGGQMAFPTQHALWGGGERQLSLCNALGPSATSDGSSSELPSSYRRQRMASSALAH